MNNFIVLSDFFFLNWLFIDFGACVCATQMTHGTHAIQHQSKCFLTYAKYHQFFATLAKHQLDSDPQQLKFAIHGLLLLNGSLTFSLQAPLLWNYLPVLVREADKLSHF